MKRSAPVVGYDAIGAKRDYRRQIWARLAKHSPVPIHHAQVLMLPSKEGTEIGIALDYGVREENIHAVDNNPALLAAAPWRKTYPAVKVYGSELPRAGERIAKRTKIDIAHLDLCANINGRSRQTLRAFGHCKVLNDQCVVALNILRGREVREEMDQLKRLARLDGRRTIVDCIRGDALSAIDHGRLSESLRALCAGEYAVRLDGSSIYKSHRSTMLWAVVCCIDVSSWMYKAVVPVRRTFGMSLQAFDIIASGSLAEEFPGLSPQDCWSICLKRIADVVDSWDNLTQLLNGYMGGGKGTVIGSLVQIMDELTRLLARPIQEVASDDCLRRLDELYSEFLKILPEELAKKWATLQPQTHGRIAA